MFAPIRILPLQTWKIARSIMSIGVSKIGLSEPAAPIPGKQPKWSENEAEIFADLHDGATVYVSGGAASPAKLSRMLVTHIQNAGLKQIRILQTYPLGATPWVDRDDLPNIRLDTAYSSASCRTAINEGRADYTPICPSDIPLLYRKKHLDIDYALIMITSPDKHGFCSLGASVGTTRSAVRNARKVIGQANDMSPITYGDSAIHSSKIDFLCHGTERLIETPVPTSTDTEQKIARFIVENLVDDGATLQLGFGRIPYAVSSQLVGHKNIGIHAEMFADGIVDLVNLGVITNSNKTVHRGRIVASYCLGTQKVFDFVNENPHVALYDIGWVNSPEVIVRNPKVTTINTSFEMDLTGQSVGDGMGTTIYTGVGGQLDYIRAASLSADGLGRPIITMTSKNSHGQSNIVPLLTEGAGVVATRAHVHYVVTEYGIAYLFGKCLRQRAYHLIKIAHPDFRESLEKAAFNRLKVMPSE